MAEAVVDVAVVKAFRTKSGNVRYVLRDADGNEYTKFREEIARAALAAEGTRAHIEFRRSSSPSRSSSPRTSRSRTKH
jgi:hypothetical protein